MPRTREPNGAVPLGLFSGGTGPGARERPPGRCGLPRGAEPGRRGLSAEVARHLPATCGLRPAGETGDGAPSHLRAAAGQTGKLRFAGRVILLGGAC